VSTIELPERLTEKTPEAVFLHVLENEFGFAKRTAHQVLEAAQESLLGGEGRERQRPGQMRMIVISLKAPFGPKLAESAKVEVTLTVDKGEEDLQVKLREGAEGLRRGRILRLTEEALEQGGVLTQEDLANALHVDRRTIVRDIQALEQDGHVVSTRGAVKNVGRGQTHKVKIIELWLNREGYDKISRWVHHSPQAIKRYVSTFLRLVVLHRQGKEAKEIAFLTQSSVKLVQDYLGLYEKALQQPYQQEKLEEELERVSIWKRAEPEKGGPTR
jgi:predicted transcriptional regulator